jgi:hypothetical protein
MVRPAAETPGKQIVVLLTENGHREGLTAVEEADAIQQLLGLKEDGLKTQAQVAGALGVSAKTISSRVGLARLPDAVKEKVHAGQVTLADAEALREFADDPGAFDRLSKLAGTRDLDWNIRQERERRRKAKARAALMAELEEAGTKIIEPPASDYQIGLPKPVNLLTDGPDSKKSIDEEVHQATCPYAAVVIRPDWQGGAEALAYCTDPVTAGHGIPAYAQRTPQEEAGDRRRPSAVEIEREKQRAAIEEKHETATSLRADFLATVPLTKKDAQVEALRLLCRHYIPRFLKETQVMMDRTLAGIRVSDIVHLGRAFGLTIPKHAKQGRPGTKAQEARDLEAARESWPLFEEAIAKATIDQLFRALVSLVRFQIEPSLRRHGGYGDRYQEAKPYLAMVDRWGYAPSEEELALRGGNLEDVAERRRDEEDLDDEEASDDETVSGAVEDIIEPDDRDAVEGPEIGAEEDVARR